MAKPVKPVKPIIGPYKGPSDFVDFPKPGPVDIPTNGILEKLQRMYLSFSHSLFPDYHEGEAPFDQALVRNLQEPINPSSSMFQQIYGTSAEQLKQYGLFEQNYRRAIANELSSELTISPERRRALQAASKDTGSIDLSLITSYNERKRLMLNLKQDVLQVDKMVRGHGFPGLYLPSSNPFRETARMVAEQTPGEYSPVIGLLQQATFSVDPLVTEQSLEDGLNIGTSSLPSLKEMEARVARGGHLSLKDIAPGTRLFLGDTETTGVTNIDIVRSISMGEGILKDTAGVRTIEMDPAVDLGARFDTAQMSGYVSADPYDLRRVTGLGTSVIEKETRFPGAPTQLAGKIFDLRTEAGRAEAKDYLGPTLKTLSEDDAMFALFNGQFDVRLISATARSLGVDDEIVTGFEERMANGGLIDILGLAREKLSNKLAKRLAAAKGTPEQKAITGLQSLLSDSALQQARVAGEAVKPFGLENILQSTNFLEILAAQANDKNKAAGDLLDLLSTSQASHVDYTDRKVSEKVLEYLDSDKLDFLDQSSALGLTPENIQKIAAARLNVASSRAIVATTNLADPRYLPQMVFDNLLETDAINRVQIDTPISEIIPGGSSDVARLKFDTDTKSFKLFTPDPTNPIGESKTIDIPSGIDPKDFIKSQINRIRNLGPREPLEMGKPVIQTLGMSPINITNIHATNQILMSGMSPKIDAFGRNLAASEDALIKGLTATSNVGFYPIPETTGFDPSITRLIRGFHDQVQDAAKLNYRQSLYESGIASASMDSDVRSALVGMSEVTSPEMVKNRTFLQSVVKEHGFSPGLSPSPSSTLSEKHITGKVDDIANQIAKKGRYLRELGAITAKTQKEIVVSESSPFLMPKVILEKASTLDDKGKTVGFLSEAAFESRGNAFRFSVATRETVSETGPTVNLIYGGKLVPGQNLKRQMVEAESIYRETTSYLDSFGSDAKKIIDSGLASSESQVKRILETFVTGDTAVDGPAKKALERFKNLYAERGVGIAQIGEGAGQVKSLIDGLVSGINSDTLSVQKGLVVSMADINETHATFVPRISDEALSEASRIGGVAGDDLIKRASPGAQKGFLESVLKRGMEDGGFFERIAKSFSSERMDTGIGGTSILADRLKRNRHLLQQVSKIKPEVYKGFGAVAAIGAGYYLGRRSQKEDLFEDVMSQQPTEPNIGPMGIADFNKVDQQMAEQYSSRRDPLVTAGVVGNLDRNKISHTRMGSDKYNHLFGA